MSISPAMEFPPEQHEAYHRARRLEWGTIVYLLSAIGLMYLVLGSSQAMRTAWMEDMLSLVPPIVFLIAVRIAIRRPSKRFPYGYHRVVSLAFLCASLALFAMGAWLLVDAIAKLVRAEHPTVGGITLFGHTIWLGWLMLPALAYSAIPAVLLGRAKLPLARTMHDKVLFADAQMNKADWMTAAAAVAGVLGVGWGYWWADSTAAALISLDILHDGFKNVREVLTNLMDETPKKVGGDEVEPLPDRVRDHLKSLPWIKDVRVRMREQGHVFFGEAFVVPTESGPDLPQRLYDAARQCAALDWRIHDLVLVAVPDLAEEPDATGTKVEARARN